MDLLCSHGLLDLGRPVCCSQISVGRFRWSTLDAPFVYVDFHLRILGKCL